MDISKHVLVPKHTKVSEEDRKELLQKYRMSLEELPRISMSDPAISHLEVTTGDIIKIDRSSPTAKTTIFFRRVVK